jgi:hypothetical protein
LLDYAALEVGAGGMTEAAPSANDAPLMISEPSMQYSPYSPTEQVSVEAKADGKSNTPFDQWHKAISDLSAEIKLRHYSQQTLKTCAMWARKFKFFARNKEVQPLSPSMSEVALLHPEIINLCSHARTRTCG